ncbi:UPF0175 family protein [Haloarcula sp. S1CR25-12]|uniref:UPF0175 family protein n=1 Tax=Haloarcula saliterrae TaxID=2950534 RepID=A0ABU2FC29_9EURY|nr:UPF0175 family protein [Haloarcula sp. S1CR25-12]MDS0259747.1 UPF0175 family protein [Haloarcula sp. S1CR25-12]
MSSTGGSANGQDPFSYLTSTWSEELELLDGFSSAFGIPSMVELAKEVQSLPPKKRFTNTETVVEEVFGVGDVDEPGLQDLPENVVDSLPNESKLNAMMPSFLLFLRNKVQETENAVIDRAVSDREHERSYLVLFAFLRELSSRLGELYHAANSDEPEDKDQLLSETLALNSWLILAAAGEVEQFDERILRDIFYARYYETKRHGCDPKFDPAELSFGEMRRKLVIDAVVAIYDRRDISVSRGAELAAVSIEQFERILEAAGISPNYGPESGAELNDGPTLSK